MNNHLFREAKQALKGAENGESDAQFRLGLMYHDGQNVKKDYEQAAYWFKKSYEQGNAEAQFLLARAYVDQGFNTVIPTLLFTIISFGLH